jgi:hypothetical protein
MVNQQQHQQQHHPSVECHESRWQPNHEQQQQQEESVTPNSLSSRSNISRHSQSADAVVVGTNERTFNKNIATSYNKQNDSSSILTNSSLSSMSTNNTANNSVISTATTNTSNPVDVHHPDDETSATPTLLRRMNSAIQMNTRRSDACNGSASISTLSTTTTTTTTTSPSEPVSPVDDTTSSSGGSMSTTTTGSGSQHHYSDDHSGNVLLHELIFDYPINVLTYPHRRQEYEEQIRNVAQAHPEWVITYNQNGYTPFHIACQTGGISLQIIQDLFFTYPSAITTPTQPPPPSRSRHRRRSSRRTSGRPTTLSSTTSWSKRTIMLPLHLTCRFYSGLEQYSIIAFLLQMYPEAAKVWTKDQSSDNDNNHHALEALTSSLTIDSITQNSKVTNATSNNEDGACGDELPIHLYCQNHFCNVLVLQHLLIPVYPEAIQKFSTRTGQLPIHLVCERQYFQRVSNKKYDSKATAMTNVPSKNSSSTSDVIIRYFLTLYPQSAAICDLQRGELPFGTALRGYQSISTLQHLLSFHAAAITHVDMKGRTPLHRYCMMLASHKGGINTNDTAFASDDVLPLLLQHDIHQVAGTMIDHAGCIPLQYVISQSNVSLDTIYTLVRSYPTSLFELVRPTNHLISEYR